MIGIALPWPPSGIKSLKIVLIGIQITVKLRDLEGSEGDHLRSISRLLKGPCCHSGD